MPQPPIRFDLEHAPPPSPLYLDDSDQITIQGWSSAADGRIVLQGRFIDLDGAVQRFQHTRDVGSDRVGRFTAYHPGEGFLLSLNMRARQATVQPGAIYARCAITRVQADLGFDALLLLQGYVTGTKTLAWPPGVVDESYAGPGNLRSVLGTDPAANTEISETVPTNARWRLRAFRATLVTDGTAATRRPILVVDDGTSTLFRIGAGVTTVASTTKPYAWIPGYPSTGQEFAEAMHFLPPDLLLDQGWRISTSTEAIQAGDNWSAPQMLVEEWLGE